MVRCLRQRLDRLAETPSDGVGGHEADDQYRQPDQAKQPGDQQRTLTGLAFDGADAFQRPLVVGDQTIAQ
ncbi:hypothetical protein D3C84_597510 [compost metagenome]